MIWQSELRCLQPRIWLQNPLSILCASCYTIRATQSNNEIAFEGITLVKSVFSFTRTLERRRDCVATIRDALFRCVSQIGAHFLFALNSYLSMERVIIWERNQIKTFQGVIGAIGAVGGLITAVTPLVEKAIDNAQNKPTEKMDTESYYSRIIS